MDWYPWYPTHFRRKTLHLTLAEDGAYRRLIDEYMILREALPDDDGALARLLGVSIEGWLAVAPAVRPYFRSAANGRLVHTRCEQELAAQENRKRRYSQRAKKAAFAKYSKINKFLPTSMLVPPTIQDISKPCLESEHTAPQQVASDEVRVGRRASDTTREEFEALMRRNRTRG